MIRSQRSQIFRLVLASTIAVAMAIGVGARLGAATVASPTVTGPVKAGVSIGDPSRDYPYSSTIDDLAKYSYLEEEYFVEGTANRYTTPALATGTIVDSGHPYKTRVMVRRPTTADRLGPGHPPRSTDPDSG
jgi:hypothetical protein